LLTKKINIGITFFFAKCQNIKNLENYGKYQKILKNIFLKNME